jgi:hypothetical protein
MSQLDKIIDIITQIKASPYYYNITTNRKITNTTTNRKKYTFDDEYSLAYANRDITEYNRIKKAIEPFIDSIDEPDEYDQKVNQCYNDNKLYSVRNRRCVDTNTLKHRRGLYFDIENNEEPSDFIDLYDNKFKLDLEAPRQLKFKKYRKQREEEKEDIPLWTIEQNNVDRIDPITKQKLNPFELSTVETGYLKDKLAKKYLNEQACQPRDVVKCLQEGKVCYSNLGAFMWRDSVKKRDSDSQSKCITLNKKTEKKMFRESPENYFYDNKYNTVYVNDRWYDEDRIKRVIDSTINNNTRPPMFDQFLNHDCWKGPQRRELMYNCYPQRWERFFGDREDQGRFKNFPDDPILDFVEESKDNDYVSKTEVLKKYNKVDGRYTAKDFYNIFEQHYQVRPEKYHGKIIYRGLSWTEE